MRKARIVVAVTGVIFFWLLAAGWLAAPLLDWAQRPPTPAAPTPLTYGARTMIVMLGTGTEYDADHKLVPKKDAFARIGTSAAIYDACKHSGAMCKVIIAGGNPQKHEASEADNYLPYLLAKQVPRADVILENRSRTTYENARNVAAILRDTPYDGLILVTSAYQMPRALLDFHRFGLQPEPLVSNTRHVQPGVLPRFDNLMAADLAMHELIGIAQFYVYRLLGWF
ncbi:YdcF family protein [Paraburkholderia sp. DHOC27]|uniref:YdcF family protein n=1 Tax=Paraburkholderia sp. DHOC27 TaxID=2303330 RepID=UPI0015F33675|nr:YdcF family protein [Paraburkholderia sp. DHOC27]